MGRARLANLPAGRATVEVRRVGYEPLAAPVLLAERDSVDVVMLVRASPAQLPAVAVVDSAPRLFLEEFDALRRLGQGRFVAPDERP